MQALDKRLTHNYWKHQHYFFFQIFDVGLYSSTNNTLVVMGITLFCYTQPIMIDHVEYIITRVIVLLAEDNKIVLYPHFMKAFLQLLDIKSDLDHRLMINVVQLKEIKGTLFTESRSAHLKIILIVFISCDE